MSRDREWTSNIFTYLVTSVVGWVQESWVQNQLELYSVAGMMDWTSPVVVTLYYPYLQRNTMRCMLFQGYTTTLPAKKRSSRSPFHKILIYNMNLFTRRKPSSGYNRDIPLFSQTPFIIEGFASTSHCCKSTKFGILSIRAKFKQDCVRKTLLSLKIQ